MLRKSFGFFCVGAILCAGCGYKYMKTPPGDISAQREDYLYLPRDSARLRSSEFGGSGAVLAAPRFVAVRHKLEIVEPSSGLPKSIEAVVAFCGTLQCEVLSSSITNETVVLSPSGNIAARVAPPDLNRFLDFVGKQGKAANPGETRGSSGGARQRSHAAQGPRQRNRKGVCRNRLSRRTADD